MTEYSEHDWKVAEEDITCYKMVLYYIREEGLYKPIVLTRRPDGTDVVYEVGKEYRAEMLDSPYALCYPFEPYVGFYSYKEPENLEGWRIDAILRCTIPEGTLYVERDVNQWRPGNKLILVSRKIRIDEVEKEEGHE